MELIGFEKEGDNTNMTNYEHIKKMSVEEMALYFCGSLPTCPLNAPYCRDSKCPECFKKWLESEAENNVKI